ncbi:hypothetical protein [Pseudoduganella sp. OTU4001]|uniref:hypothetical protein n=1 Tax=Pseudoduganella sp. OTU4001 TaxID=3043854 RepID=UPI00313AC428
MRKRIFVALAALVAVALATGGAWYYKRQQERGSLPCAQQPPSQFSPYCLAQAQAAAGRRDRAAMMSLVEYFEKRQPAEAVRWTRAAAALGEPRAISRVLSTCGEGKAFTLAEAQALLPQAPQMEVLNFQLGGSCAGADFAVVRGLHPAQMLSEPDSAGLCKVAVRYGLLRLSRDGAQLDSQAAQQMLAECERRPQISPTARRQAESVRQMLAREIRPVHISVD